MGQLQQISGIGEATERALNEVGIETLVDLANANPADISHISGGAAFIIKAREARGQLRRESTTRIVEGSGGDVKEVPDTRLVASVPSSGSGRDYHPASPWRGQEPDPAVIEAVEYLAKKDAEEGRPPLRTEHIINWDDKGMSVVLSCEPGGKRVYVRDPELRAALEAGEDTARDRALLGQ